MCFPMDAIINLMIWCVVIVAVLMILRLLMGFALPRMGVGAEIVALLVQVWMIVLWAFVAIAVLSIIGDAIFCLISMAPSIGHFGR
jgi:hypothetical protein